MSELLGIARFKFHEGKREEYLRLSEQAREIVRTKDSGTLAYDLEMELAFAGLHQLCMSLLDGLEKRLTVAHRENLALARPTGFNRADAIHIRVPIEGAGEVAIQTA